MLPPRTNLRYRRGVLVLAVLAGLALVGSLLAVWLKLLMLERQEVRAQQNRLQAQYLAEAGLARAEKRLASNADYSGETWKIPPATLNSREPAQITITVESIDDDPQARNIAVSAQIADTGPARVVRGGHRTIHLPEQEQSP